MEILIGCKVSTVEPDLKTTYVRDGPFSVPAV